MRIAVLGAGAVGCYYGGLLARAGHDVTLIGRPAHVEAIRTRGLRMVWDVEGREETVRVAAAESAEAASGAAWVLVTVKSGDTQEAACQLAGHLAPGAVVLSLQNGVDNAETLVQGLAACGAPADARVVPVVVYVATRMDGPGVVRHLGGGRLVAGAGPDCDAVRRVFEAAGDPVQVQVVPDVRVALWTKLAANCVWNPLSAIAGAPYGLLAGVDGIGQAAADVIAECRAVALAEGVELPADLEESVGSLPETMPDQLSSTQQDLARGRRTEIEHLNGYVARRGAVRGVPTPVTSALAALVRALEPRG